MLEKISLPDMEEEDDSLTTTVLTCKGDIHDPAFPKRLHSLVSKLQRLILKTEKPLWIRKVEPWNSVRVTFSIPKEAAERLRQLAAQGDQALRELGILSVQTEGDQVITLTLAGQNGETQEIVLNKAPDNSQSLDASHSGSITTSANSAFTIFGGGESLPGPSNAEASRKNIVQYLTQQGNHPVVAAATSSATSEDGPGLLDRVLPSTSGAASTSTTLPMQAPRQRIPYGRGVGFRSPNVVAPASSDLPFLASTCNSAGVIIAKPTRHLTAPGKSNYGPFPFASMTHAMNTKHSSSSSTGSGPASGLHHQKVLNVPPAVTITTTTPTSTVGSVTLGFSSSQYSNFAVSSTTSSSANPVNVLSTSNSLLSHTVTQVQANTLPSSSTPCRTQSQSAPSLQVPSAAVLTSLVSRVATSVTPSMRANIALSSPLLVNLLQSDVPGNQSTKMLPPPAPDDNNQPQKKKRKPRKPRDKPGGLHVSNPGIRIEDGLSQAATPSMSSAVSTSFSLQTSPSNTLTRTQPSDFESLKAIQSGLTAMHHNIPQVIHPQAQGQPQVDIQFPVGSPPIVRSLQSHHAHQLLLHTLPYAANAQSSLAARLTSSLLKDSVAKNPSNTIEPLNRLPATTTAAGSTVAADGKTKHLINPITGHLEPMPSDEEEEESADSLPLFTEPETDPSENGQSERSLSDSKETSLNAVLSDTDSGISKSNTDISQSSVEFLPSEAMKERLEDSSSGSSTFTKHEGSPPDLLHGVTNIGLITNTTVTTSPVNNLCTSQGELKLRLKLDPRTLKDTKELDSKDKRPRPGGESLLVANVNAGKTDLSFASIPNVKKNHTAEPKVPPLHISLRGPNAAVVVSPRKDGEYINHTLEIFRSEQKKPRVSKISKMLDQASSINHLKDVEGLSVARKPIMNKSRAKGHGGANDRLREQKLLSGGLILPVMDGSLLTPTSLESQYLQMDSHFPNQMQRAEISKQVETTKLDPVQGSDTKGINSPSSSTIRTNHFISAAHRRLSFPGGEPHSSRKLETQSESGSHSSINSTEPVSKDQTVPRVFSATVQGLSLKTKDFVGSSPLRREHSLLKSAYVYQAKDSKVKEVVCKKVLEPILTEAVGVKTNESPCEALGSGLKSDQTVDTKNMKSAVQGIFVSAKDLEKPELLVHHDLASSVERLTEVKIKLDQDTRHLSERIKNDFAVEQLISTRKQKDFTIAPAIDASKEKYELLVSKTEVLTKDPESCSSDSIQTAKVCAKGMNKVVEHNIYRNHIDVNKISSVKTSVGFDGQNKSSVLDNPASDKVCLVNINRESLGTPGELESDSQVIKVPSVSIAVPNMVGKTELNSQSQNQEASSADMSQNREQLSCKTAETVAITTESAVLITPSTSKVTSSTTTVSISVKDHQVINKIQRLPEKLSEHLEKIVENGNVFSEESSIDSLDDNWGHRKESSTNKSGIMKLVDSEIPVPDDTRQAENCSVRVRQLDDLPVLVQGGESSSSPGSTNKAASQSPATDERLKAVSVSCSLDGSAERENSLPNNGRTDLDSQKWLPKIEDVPQELGLPRATSPPTSSILCNTKADSGKVDSIYDTTVASASPSYAISEAKSSNYSAILTPETMESSRTLSLVTVNGCAQEASSAVGSRPTFSLSDGQGIVQPRTVMATTEILSSSGRSLLLTPTKLNKNPNSDSSPLSLTTVASTSSVMSSTSPIIVSQQASPSLNTLLACNRNVFGCGESGKVTLIFKSASGSSQSHSLLSSGTSTGSMMVPLKSSAKSVPIKLVALPSSCSTAFAGRTSNTLFEIIGQSSQSAHATLPASSATTTPTGTMPSSSSPVRLVVSKVAPMGKSTVVPSTIAQAGPRTTTVVVKSVVVTSSPQSLKILPSSNVAVTQSSCKVPDEGLPKVSNSQDDVLNPPVRDDTTSTEHSSLAMKLDSEPVENTSSEYKPEIQTKTNTEKPLNGPLSCESNFLSGHGSNSAELAHLTENADLPVLVAVEDSQFISSSNELTNNSTLQSIDNDTVSSDADQVPELSRIDPIVDGQVENQLSPQNPPSLRPRNGSTEELTSAATTEDENSTQTQPEFALESLDEEKLEEVPLLQESLRAEAVFTKPVKRKCSENAAELIKACMGVEDNPKKVSLGRVKEDATLNEKNSKEKLSEDEKTKWVKRKGDELYRKGKTKGSNSECSSDDELSLSELVNKSRIKSNNPVITPEEEKDFIRTRNSRSILQRQQTKESGSEDNNSVSNSRTWRRKSGISSDNRSKGETVKKAIFRDSKKIKRTNQQVPKATNDRIKKYQARSRVQSKEHQDVTPSAVVSSGGIPSAFPPTQSKEESNFELPQLAKRKTRSGGSTDTCDTGLPVPTTAKRRRVSKDSHR